MRVFKDLLKPFQSRRCGTSRGRLTRRLNHAGLERLEPRYAMTAVAGSNFPIAVVQDGTELTITYSQPDPTTSFAVTSDQHVVIDIDEYFAGIGVVQQRVNVYASTNPAANFSAPVAANKTFLGITAIHVTVPNYDDPGVNNNSLTIKGINQATDRIIVSGSGRTAAGRWSDETAQQLQTVFDIAGIDDLTVTAGGVINVSGAFTNDTGDASIHAVGEIVEREADQMTATIIIGETTPSSGSLPQSRLVSNYIEIIGAELDIYSDIEATGQVILRQPATTPQSARANLILPYDVTLTDPDGVLELHSTRSIVQLQSSTLVAHKLVAVSNVGDINAVDAGNSLNGPWLIDLGSVNNDFDTVSFGMVSNAIDTPAQDQSVDARGRIGVRDIDDMTVGDFGILASTGIVTLRSVGALTVDAAVQAAGLTLQSDTSVVTTPRAIISVNSPTPNTGSTEPVVYTDLGVTIDVSTASGDTATGDVTLDGRIVMDRNNVRETDTTTNKTGYGGLTIHATGVTTLNSQVLTLGDIRVFSKLGITVAGQLQAGGTFVSKNGTVTELVAADLSLTTATGGITVSSPTANLAIPTTLSATNFLVMDAGGDISIGGSLFAGSLYGNTSKLPENNATLPSISIRSAADVEMTQTAVLRTSAYGTNYNASPNPQIGLITVSDANTLTSAATIIADGALVFSTRGDIALSGSATAREQVSLRTQVGNIDVQGSMRATGASYTVNTTASPPFIVPASWTPDVVLNAPNGAIATSDTGSLTAGNLTIGEVKTFGAVRLNSQQNISIGADIDTPGAVVATSKLGAFELSALLQSNNGASIAVSAGNGVVESDLDLARISTSFLDVFNTGAAGGTSDIDLRAKNNQIGVLVARNLATDGSVFVASAGAIAIRDIFADTTISLAGQNGITQEAGSVKAHSLTVSNANNAAVTLANSANNVVQFAGTTLGSLTYVDADDFETGGIVARVGVPGDIKVEVKADALSLSSVGALSTIRVVSGLQYKTLRIAAGTLGGASVGTVELVTTSPLDNFPGFQGELRDMIRYANDNTATYASAGSQIPQRTAMVFDEDGYPFQEIVVAAALPGFVKPVAFEGSRLEASVSPNRLGIKGNVKISTGLFFGLGSSGSRVDGTAVYGFKDGSAISLASSNNKITNTYAGVKADGTTASANSVGLDLTGANARSNIIGSTVFDDTTANRFSANTNAGILIRAGASNNRIFGNILGDDTGLAPTFANGDGIRLNAAGGGNQIGTPSEVGPDLVPVVSNRIVGNKGNGIAFVNTIATGSQTNRVRNNEIDSNGTGITISASSFAVIGGPAAHAANVITRQTKAGISLTGSKDVDVIANFIGVDAELTTTLMGNMADGMAIASSQRVNIAGNRISANTRNGIYITTGSTAVTIASNTIGGVLEDGSASGNVLDGVAINASIGNSISNGNVISHNGNGVSVTDARGTAATGNKIVGSEIASNTQNGVLLAGGSGTTIGGTTDGTHNTIISNTTGGIRLEKTTKTGAPTSNLIQGNFIGTNENRDVDPSLGNGGNGITVSLGTFNTASGNVVMNNAVDGMLIEGGNDNTVGGILASAGNVIANNTANGISIKQSGSFASTGHRIYGNTIVENGGNGVEVNGLKTSKIFVGQDTTGKVVAGRGNTITDNFGAGVKIIAAKQVAVQGNTMGNNGSHIELGSNANPLSGTVTLTSAVFRQPPGGGGKQVEIVGTIAGGKPNQVYSVDFYANDPGDKEGIRRFIGRGTATADSHGNARIRMTISSDVLLQSTITATATSLRYDIGQSTGTLLGGVENPPIVRLR